MKPYLHTAVLPILFALAPLFSLACGDGPDTITITPSADPTQGAQIVPGSPQQATELPLPSIVTRFCNDSWGLRPAGGYVFFPTAIEATDSTGMPKRYVAYLVGTCSDGYDLFVARTAYMETAQQAISSLPSQQWTATALEQYFTNWFRSHPLELNNTEGSWFYLVPEENQPPRSGSIS